LRGVPKSFRDDAAIYCYLSNVNGQLCAKRKGGFSMFQPRLVVLAIVSFVFTFVGQLSSQTIVFTDDFEDGARPEWSIWQTDITPAGARSFLGQFSNQSVELKLNNVPAHSWVTLSFDLFIIRSWDGNSQGYPEWGPDMWQVRVKDGPILLETTFSNADGRMGTIILNQSYPSQYPTGNHPPRNGAKENNTLGYNFLYAPGMLPTDSVYSITSRFEHQGDSIKFIFSAPTLQDINDESWGLDNVKVEIDQNYYENNFEGTLDPEWSDRTRSITPIGGRKFLGRFSDQNVRLVLNNLPQHTSIKVSFDLFMIQSMDGNASGHPEWGPDIWKLWVSEGSTLIQTTFSNIDGHFENITLNQSYPGSFPGGNHPPLTGASEINTLGYQSDEPAPMDSVYQMQSTFSHTDNQLILNFTYTGITAGLIDESWGLDNVRLEIVNESPPEKTPVIIIPGVMGSELRDAETNELFWLDPDKAMQANDPWLLALSLQTDGITPDTNSRCVNGWEKICDENNECASHSCAPGGRNLIAKDILNIDDFILKGYTEYKKLVKFLGENNYSFRRDVFLHAYDWRRDLSEKDKDWSAIKFLRNMIVEIAPTPNDRVNIIAHSMGGLVMRSYLSYYSDDHRIETVIYLGTPHSGSPGTYAILMGYYKLINDKELLLSSINAVTSTFICQNFPGMYQLLPSDPFVTEEGVGGLTLDETYQNLPNSTLVEKARDFHDFIKDFNPIERSFAINGSGLATFSTVRIETKVKTHEECIWAFTGNGDNTVPQRSSSSLIGDREYFVKGKHAELPGNEAAHKKILKILQGKENDPDDPNEVKTTPFELGKTWNWTSCCPINLEITDLEDNVNGVDKENNDIRQDISESGFFSFPNNESGFMPYDNEYRIKIKAFNDGEFTLTLNLVEPDESISKTLAFSDVPIGNTSTGDLVLSPDTDNVILSLDVEGDGVADYELTANAEVPTELSDRFSERGDFNKDNNIDISDGVAILSFLFLGGSTNCKLAGDTNKDGAIDVSDAIYILSFLFLGGQEVIQENVLCE